MRLFTAIEIPESILWRLERLICSLRHEAQVNWSPMDNLHITTKFIGQWPEPRLEELVAVLERIGRHGPLSIHLRDLGWFPNERSPRVLHIGVEGGEALRNLAQQTDECLQPLGVAPEQREYSPHLTLARIKNAVPLQRLRQRVSELAEMDLGRFEATEFALFRSDPGSNASVYRRLMQFRLEATKAAS